MLNEALSYARRGWYIFPLSPKTKKPLKNSAGFKDATNKINEIKDIWKTNHQYNVGIATGHISNLLILDVDNKDGKDGAKSLQHLIDQHSDLPDTVEMLTPSGSKQIWFLMPKDQHISISADKLGEGLDIRANGGYTLAPPSYVARTSKYPYSGQYEWFTDQSPEEIEIAEAPKWLVDLLIQEEPDKDPFLHISKSNIDLDIIKVAKKYDIKLKKDSDKLYGSHPIHGSSNGQNFFIDTKKGLWHCFRHNNGGNALSLIAMLEGVLECPYCTKGALTGNKFKKTLDIATKNFKFNPKTLHRDSKGVIWDRDQQLNLKPTFNNCMNMMPLIKEVKYDDFAKDIYYDGEIMQDEHLYIIKERFREESFEPSINTIFEAIHAYGIKNKVNPVKDYLNSLKWDGVPRLEQWLVNHCGAEDIAYTRRISKMTLVAAVARVFNPGVKYDHMLILEGEQGIKKSSVIEALGGEHYREVSLMDADKDTVQKIKGGWIIEVAEMVAFRKKEIESLKAFISRQVDDQRFAYKRVNVRLKRQYIMIGSINPQDGYLSDPTGNRRFFPVEVKAIDVEAIKRERDQLFAEAVQAYKEKYPLYLQDNEKTVVDQAIREQQARETHDEWEEVISTWIHNRKYDISTHVTCKQVYLEAFFGDVKTLEGRITRRISNILTKLGAKKEKYPRYINGISGRYFDISAIDCTDSCSRS